MVLRCSCPSPGKGILFTLRDKTALWIPTSPPAPRLSRARDAKSLVKISPICAFVAASLPKTFSVDLSLITGLSLPAHAGVSQKVLQAPLVNGFPLSTFAQKLSRCEPSERGRSNLHTNRGIPMKRLVSLLRGGHQLTKGLLIDRLAPVLLLLGLVALL